MKSIKLTVLMASAILALSACNGDDGSKGETGASGATGSTGSNGLNSLVTQTQLDEGHELCPEGGVEINSGIDLDSNGVLASNEVDDTQYVCLPFEEPIAADDNTYANEWFVNAKSSVEEAITDYSVTQGEAKNIILFVGDGMGVSTVTAARILEGQLKGMQGEENTLSFGKFPFAGLAKTYNVDAQTPDSAGTMTAMMSGLKTDVGVIGVDEDVVRGDCLSVDGNEVVTALEMAEVAGKATGVVSTARITHATPAATYAKSADRNWEDISDMPQDAIDVGCEDIALQLVYFEDRLESRIAGADVDGLEVVMGGGRRHFLPKDDSFNSPDASSSTEGDRTDLRDLISEWQGLYPDGEYVYDRNGFKAIDTENTPHLFGLFNESHMQYEADRDNDIAGEPSLREMTETAINVLDNDSDGFLLMVESGRIDHGHHAGSAYNALTDTIEFAEAVQKAVDLTDPSETLIIVTADHSHVFTIAGYPKRGNPILGKVVPVGSDSPSMASDGMPYTTLGYTNGRGYRNLGSETDADATYGMDPDTGRKDLLLVDTESTGFHQEALIPLSSETHAGEDIGIHAMGPGAPLVSGTNEQNIIFHIMAYAGNLEALADAQLD